MPPCIAHHLAQATASRAHPQGDCSSLDIPPYCLLQGELPPRMLYVGRLDVATTGLLFLTNDGEWANKVAHPSGDLTKVCG